MPYRTELRRPDLKGTFRCSLCNKIFCHSSSLSRHRMQAHFKSYTCTLCNKEITTSNLDPELNALQCNETLRAHMYKKHQISRMFMCRCCNWAFPDKTSLHIHMQAMATGNPGNVSIIAKSSTSPPPGASAAAAAALNGLSQSPSSRSPSESNGNGMINTSPLSLTPPGLAGGIFPSMPSREELINRIRDRAIFGGLGASTNGQSHTSAPAPPNGPTFDLSSFFPNIAAAAKLGAINQSALASLLPHGFFPTAPPNQNALNLKTDNGRKVSKSSQRQSNEDDMDDNDYPGAMVIDEDEGDEINCEIGEDEDMETNGNGGMNGDDYGHSDEPQNATSDGQPGEDDGSEEPYPHVGSVPRDMDSPALSSANGSRRSSINIRKNSEISMNSVTVNVKESPLASLQQQFERQQQDLPILRSAISASPLNSLLYQKKLNNALRNKNTDASLMANFFYPNPLQQLQQVQMQLAAAAQQQQQRPHLSMHQQRRKSSSAASTSSITNAMNLSQQLVNGFMKSVNDGQLKRETPSPLIPAPDHAEAKSNLPSDGNGSHISPTESSVGSSSASTASSAGQTSPTSILDTLAAAAGVAPGSIGGVPSGRNGEPCPQCSVLKGRLALTENRCRFLESKTTSQESKISRLESRIGTLESNGRRYENEAHMLRDHCEQLERKVLDCQERVLRYLQGQQYDQDTTKQMLYDILEVCRVYKPA